MRTSSIISIVRGFLQINQIDDIIADLEDRYFSDINTKLWDQLDFPEDASELTNDSFFKTLNEHL